MEFVFIGSILGPILDFAALTQTLRNTRIYQKSLHLTLILVSSYLSRFLLSLFYLASVNYFLLCRLSNAFRRLSIYVLSNILAVSLRRVVQNYLVCHTSRNRSHFRSSSRTIPMCIYLYQSSCILTNIEVSVILIVYY